MTCLLCFCLNATSLLGQWVHLEFGGSTGLDVEPKRTNSRNCVSWVGKMKYLWNMCMLIHHMMLIIYFKFIYDVLLLHLFRYMCLSYSTLLPCTHLHIFTTLELMKTTWFYPMVWLAFTMGFTCFEIICCDDFSAESSAFHWDKFVEWHFGHHGVRRSIGGSIPGTKLVGLPRLAVLVLTFHPWAFDLWRCTCFCLLTYMFIQMQHISYSLPN